MSEDPFSSFSFFFSEVVFAEGEEDIDTAAEADIVCRHTAGDSPDTAAADNRYSPDNTAAVRNKAAAAQNNSADSELAAECISDFRNSVLYKPEHYFCTQKNHQGYK